MKNIVELIFHDTGGRPDCIYTFSFIISRILHALG